jgi:hypothetical protein
VFIVKVMLPVELDSKSPGSHERILGVQAYYGALGGDDAPI